MPVTQAKKSEINTIITPRVCFFFPYLTSPIHAKFMNKLIYP